MTSLRDIAIIVSTLACAGGALAQGYVGVGIGQSNARVDCTDTTLCDKTDTAFKLFGGFQFSPNWGLEAAYYDQGKVKQAGVDPTLGNITGEWKGSGLGLFGLAVMPLDRASVFAKLGIVRARVKLTATSSIFGGASETQTHTNAAWGLGAGYDFDKAWSGRFEFERLRVKFMDEKVNVNLLTLGAVYRF